MKDKMHKPGQLEMSALIGGSVERVAQPAAPPAAPPTATPSWAARMLAKAGLTAAQVAPAASAHVAPEEDWISTSEAGKILGKSQRRIQSICDEGVLLQPIKDWRKLPPKPGVRQGGHYQIRRASVMRLEQQVE